MIHTNIKYNYLLKEINMNSTNLFFDGRSKHCFLVDNANWHVLWNALIGMFWWYARGCYVGMCIRLNKKEFWW